MNTKRLLLGSAAALLPGVAFGFARIGFGVNFGYPIYDYPRPTNVYVVEQPVATEVPPPSPGLDYIWIAGRWEWDTAGKRWVWQGGSWQKPPSPGAVWQTGYWSMRNGAWTWIASHWAVAQPASSTQTGNPPTPPSAPPSGGPEITEAGTTVDEAPPAPIVEEIYPAPGPDYIWISGEWTWNGRWIWAPGHYIRRPHDGAVWVAGFWDRRLDGRYIWHQGHWR